MQKVASKTAFGILAALSLAHMLNDAMQSVLNAVYPLIKKTLELDFGQIGKIALVYQISASIFQPLLGYYLDKKPNAWFLPIGMLFTMGGLLGLAYSTSFEMAMCSVFFSGIGSSVLHPEASRLVSLASGGRKGLAQSVFQVGGSTGWAFG
ncbi:MAG: MFS transporter, partial [Opitutales bacterium]|nr:MFS transporter [Opitutales bacterium]